MDTVFIFSLLLQALLHAICFGEPCLEGWSTETTIYRILHHQAEPFVHVSCTDRNFQVDGGRIHVCSNGLLPTNLPHCIPSKGSCPRLKAPAYGSMKCSETAPEVGSTCVFQCLETHYMNVKSRNRTCSENLRWTGSPVSCLRDQECPNPLPLHQGTVIDCPPEKKIRPNDACNFKCNEGFELKGPSRLICRLDGKLTDERGYQTLPTCLRISTVNSAVRSPRRNEGLAKKNYSITRRSCKDFNGYCTYRCHETAEGVRCSCKTGFQLSRRDGRSCHDINECLDASLNKCDHFCQNTDGGYNCTCRAGYTSPDGFRCEEETTYGAHDPLPPNCENGYRLDFSGRFCVDIDECADESVNKCGHTCRNTDGGYQCLCRSGYLSPDGFRCEDINECSNSSLNKCDHKCVNTIGGYTCRCRAGFVSPDGYRCEGCRVNSYRGPSDLSCKECPSHSGTDGEGKTSIRDCICTSGYTGNPGRRIPCKDIDECADGEKFGCSHSCINTPGSAHCTCPLGYQLKEDQKTCQDIDECSIKNGGCDGICHNTIGNFTCSCPVGYVASPDDKYRCDDVDECAEGNGGCSNHCVNFKGGFHCSCGEGHHLHPDGKSCIPVYCPRVFVPHHSTIRCRRMTEEKKIFLPGEMPEDEEFPVGTICRLKCAKGYDAPDSTRAILCQKDGKWNASLPDCKGSHCSPLNPPSNGDVYPPSCKEGSATVKQKCFFTCNPGYRLTGQERRTCRNNLTWANKKPTKCVPEKNVSISCPDDDITIDLLPREGWAALQLNAPRVSLAAGPVRVNPPWISLNGTSIFPVGETEVTFSVTKDNVTAECSISVIVQDKHPPVFFNCPETLSLTSSTSGTVANWKEPFADDNVGIASISKSLEPNSTLTPGLHFVEYVARDFSGNVGQCIFQINVTVAGCEDLMDPENGEANCMEWLYGKICQPACFENFTRPLELFACDESGAWTPADFISPCLPECMKNETWSLELQKCV